MAIPVVVIPADGTVIPASTGRYAILLQDANRNQIKGSVSTQIATTSSLVFTYELTNDLTTFSSVASTTSNSAGDTSNGVAAVTPAAGDHVHGVFPNAKWAVINVSGTGTFSPIAGDGVKFL